MDTDIQLHSEQEAAVALLFATVMHNKQTLGEAEIDQLSRMLVLSSKFKSNSLHELSKNALSLRSVHSSKVIIEEATQLISQEFKETLFAMVCEVMTRGGKINEEESEIIALVALHLGISMDTMKMILTTYLIRNRWNVQIVETPES